MTHTPEGKEYEVKILDITERKHALQESLQTLWASIKVDGILTATTVKHPTSGQEIRIRETAQKDGTREIHAEEKTLQLWENMKGAQEIQHPVQDTFADTLAHYESQWFAALYHSVKTRVEYILRDSASGEDMKFAFDLYHDITGLPKWVVIPEFLEIETEDISAEKALERIKKYAEILGISVEEFKNWGPRKLIEHYSKK